jgi:hypothetical protein
MKKLIWMMFLILGACIEPYKIDMEEGVQLLTVEGIVTTEKGPQQIKLTRSDTYGSVFQGLVRPVRRATVAIRSNEGEVVFLPETGQGIYTASPDFKVEVGKTYTLLIELQTGERYTSLPELVRPVTPLDSVSFRSVSIPTSNRMQDRVGAQIKAHFRDPESQRNYYYWRFPSAVFALITNPELFLNPRDHLTDPKGPAPKPCCATCYMEENRRVQPFHVLSDENFDGLRTEQVIGFIEDDGLRFKDTYRTDVQQLSISPEAFQFLKLVQQQVGLTGSVFDPPPANIRGNILSLDNPQEQVLGYFIAASSQTNRIYIRKEDMAHRAPPKSINDDCRTVPGAEVSPPEDWQGR